MAGKTGVVGRTDGGGIALEFALARYDVLLSDVDEGRLEAATARLRTLLERGVGRGFYTADQVEPTMGRIRTTVDLAAMADVDMVTEAVFEDETVKAGVLAALDRVCRPVCIIATNTSTIPISTLAAMRKVDKVPIRVKDVAGVAVNRMLHMFINEAVKLVEEGVATPEDLDTGCRLGLGHLIGPFALMDAVTSSLCVQAQEIMQEAYGERFQPPALLKQRVRAGYVGGKGRPGWR